VHLGQGKRSIAREPSFFIFCKRVHVIAILKLTIRKRRQTWVKKHEQISNFNIVDFPLRRYIYGTTSGESKREYSSFRPCKNFSHL
jgi:hypothetical protein